MTRYSCLNLMVFQKRIILKASRLPYSMTSARRAVRGRTGDVSWKTSSGDRCRIGFLPELDLFYSDLTVDELVHVCDDDWTLNVHQRKRGGWVSVVENIRASREQKHAAHPLNRPVQAPVAEPGLTKNLLSYSIACTLYRD
jgi:hypothetical protein